MEKDTAKEGVDFEWVTAKGSNYKTRRFFTAAEKKARTETKAAPKAEKKTRKSAPPAAKTTSPRPQPKPAKPAGGRGDGMREMVTRAIDRGEREQKASREALSWGVGEEMKSAREARRTRGMPAAGDMARKQVEATPVKRTPSAGRTKLEQYQADRAARAAERKRKYEEEIRAMAGQMKTAKPRKYTAVPAKGYAKGGIVKTNCGASMKPTQKR